MNPEILNKILATANESMNRWEFNPLSKESALVEAVFYHCERARVLFDFVSYKRGPGGDILVISATIIEGYQEYCWLDFVSERNNDKWIIAKAG